MTTPPPRPEPPIPPDDGLCCKSGCVPCVWDLYDEDLEAYRKALAEWEAQHGSQAAPRN